jgi:predicted nucleotidyltransferase
MDQEEVIAIIRRYLSNLTLSGLPIRKAFLYGSYARNEATESSDIDVLLVSDMFDTQDDVILSKPWSPKLRIDYRIEPYVVGTNKFRDDDVSLILEMVRREGIEISI